MMEDFDSQMPSIVGMQNIPGTNKYRITLTCGHECVADHDRDPISLATTFECMVCGTVNRNTN